MNGGRAWWRDGGGEELLGLHSRVLGLPMHVGLGVVPETASGFVLEKSTASTARTAL